MTPDKIAQAGLAIIARAHVACTDAELNAALAVREMLTAIATGRVIVTEAPKPAPNQESTVNAS
jgi:hypothetical protein